MFIMRWGGGEGQLGPSLGFQTALVRQTRQKELLE